MPDSATEMIINLAPHRLFGELNGDGVEDAAVILIAAPGGSGPFYGLSAVLGEDRPPRPLASHFLGDLAFIRGLRIDDVFISVELDVAGPDDPLCRPTDHRQQVYALEGEKPVLVGEEDLPDPELSARLDVPQKPIRFEPASTSATYQEEITFNGIHADMVQAMAGQTMTATVESLHSDVLLSISGGGRTLASFSSEVANWTGWVPTAQDYTTNLVAVGSDPSYTLTVEIVGEARPAPSSSPVGPATPTRLSATEAATPISSEKVIHINFDGGPTGPQWTPQVLDVLAEHDAVATFFVPGHNARRYPEVIQAEYEASHVIANHTLLPV